LISSSQNLNLNFCFNFRTEPVTGHLLLSSKKANHTVFRILKENDVEPSKLFEPVLQINGGNRTQTLLTRSVICTYKQGNDSKLLVAANEEVSKTVKIWSVSEGGNVISDLKMTDNVLDISELSFNNNKYFAFLSDKKVNIYELNVK
jgi:hypothetical protein